MQGARSRGKKQSGKTWTLSATFRQLSLVSRSRKTRGLGGGGRLLKKIYIPKAISGRSALWPGSLLYHPPLVFNLEYDETVTHRWQMGLTDCLFRLIYLLHNR